MRKFTDGAEGGDILFWDSYSGTFANSTNYARSGTRSYSLGNNSYCTKYLSGSGLSELYYRNCPYEDPLASIAWRNTFLNAGGTSIELRDNTATRKIDMYINNVLIISSSAILSTSTHHCIETHIIVDDVNGLVQVKADGVLTIDYSGDTKITTYTTITAVRQYSGGGTGYFDDVALNDTDNSDGKNDNSWCGDGHVEPLLVISDGDVTNWVMSSGSTHWGLVDEIPPDGDTTYVSASTAGIQDMYGLSNISLIGKGPVTRLWSEVRARDAESLAGPIKLGVKTGSTVALQTTSASLPSTFTRIVGDEYIINPDTGGAWTESQINSLQFVIENET